MRNDKALYSVAAKPHNIAPPADSNRKQWIQLLPAGEISTKDGRSPFYMDDAEAVIATSFELANGNSLPVDYNHAIDLAEPKGARTPAAGWILAMEARSNGIWGQIEWTPSALKAILDREFRHISPVLMHSKSRQVYSIARASLTNNPNLTMVALNAAGKGKDMETEQFLSRLREVLELEDDADFTAILKALQGMLESRNSADPTKYVPLETFQKTVEKLNRLNKGISLQSAENHVDHAIGDGHLMPFMRDWAVSLCTADRQVFDDFIAGAGKPVKDFVDTLQRPAITVTKSMHQRSGGEIIPDEISANLGLSDEDIKKYGQKETE